MHLHPLPALLHRCLKITLSTEEPLQTHRDLYPINEEYATSQKCFRLSALDVTQMMRNSVLMSSFSDATKKAWLGDGWEDGPGNRGQVGEDIPSSCRIFTTGIAGTELTRTVKEGDVVGTDV